MFIRANLDRFFFALFKSQICKELKLRKNKQQLQQLKTKKEHLDVHILVMHIEWSKNWVQIKCNAKARYSFIHTNAIPSGIKALRWKKKWANKNKEEIVYGYDISINTNIQIYIKKTYIYSVHCAWTQ